MSLKPYLDVWHGDAHLTVDRRAMPKNFVSEVTTLVARYRDRKVYLIADDRALEMDTPTAVKFGLAMCAAAGECIHTGDVVYIRANGVGFHLLPYVALQVGGVMVKKADRADDFQRENPRRLVTS